MLFELYHADGVCRDPRKSAILGGGTLFKKMNAAYARLPSKGQAAAIVCTDMFDAMAIVRQRKGTTPGKKFLWRFSVMLIRYNQMINYSPCKSPL